MPSAELSALSGLVGGVALGWALRWVACGTPSPYGAWLGRPCWVRPVGRAEWREHVVVAVSWHGAVCVRRADALGEDGYWIKKQNVRWRVLWDAPGGAMLAHYHIVEAEVAERYMELPTDADGVPIRIGDVIENDCTMPTEVTHMECFWAKNEEPFWTLWWGDAQHYGKQDEDWGSFPDCASTYRHHQPDTWERIIKDAAQFGHDDDPSNINVGKFVARCEALAGGE